MLDFKKDYILSNQIVELRPLLREHEALLFDESNDVEIWRYFSENGYGKTNFEQYINNAIHKREKEEEYPFVIKDLRNNKFAGITRIYAVDNKLKNVKIGHTWIGKQFQGTGLNKNCKFLLFELLFEKLHIKRIGFGASAKNLHSIRAMESVGCVQEGRLRSFLPDSDSARRIDVVLLSILKDEWETKVRTELKQKIERHI